jgi:methyl-accepting chemotaxis protein
VKLVAETGRSLERIAGKVSDINHAVAEIATSAQEQATSLQQVNIAVNHMDHVTQQNAAMAEESTAASRSLALETEQLSRMVMEFSFTPTTTATDGLRTELQRVVPHAFASSQPPAAKPERAGSVGPGGNIKSIGDGKLRRVASAGKVVTWEEF